MANGQLNLGKQSGGVLSVSFPDGVNNTDVVLPESGNIVSIDGSVTDNAIPRYDGTTGKLQNSGVTIDDNGNVGIGINTPNPWASYLRVLDIGINGSLTARGSNNAVQLISNMYDNGSTWVYKNNGYASVYSQVSGYHTWLSATTGTAGNNVSLSNLMSLTTSGDLLLTSGKGALGYGTGAGGTVTQLTSKSTAVTLNKPSGQITMNNAALAAGATVSFTVNNSLVTVSDQVVPKVGQASLLYSIVVSSVGNGSFVLYLKNEDAASRSEAINVTFSIIKGAVA